MKMFLRGRPVPMLIPDELAPTYSLDTRSELPSCRLKLDWVYPFALIPTSPPPHPVPQPGGGKSPSGVRLWHTEASLYRRWDFPDRCGTRGQGDPGVRREHRKAG